MGVQHRFCHKNMQTRTKPFGAYLGTPKGKNNKGLENPPFRPPMSRLSSPFSISSVEPIDLSLQKDKNNKDPC